MRLDLLWLAFALLPQENRGRVVRQYSLAPLRPGAAVFRAPRYGGFLPAWERSPVSPSPFLQFREDASPGLASTDILETLRAALGGADASIDVQEESLVVQGSEDQQKIVAAALRDLAAGPGKPLSVDVTVHWLPFTGAAMKSGILAAEDAASQEAALRDASRPLWSATLEALPGQPVAAGLDALVPYVANYRCEVAKKSKMAEPIVETFHGGIEVSLQANPSISGGSVHLTALVSHSDLRGIQRFKTRAENVGSIDIPQVAGIRVAGTGLVPNGSALVLCAGGAESGVLWVSLRPRGAAPTRRIAADAGAKPVLLFAPPIVSVAAGRALPALDLEFNATTHASAIQGNPLDPLRGDAAVARLQLTPGGSILAAGEAAALDAIVQRVQALEDSAAGNLGIEIRIVNANDPKGAVAPNAPAVASASLAASAGRSSGCVLGIEESVVAGYSSHVAEEVAIANPEVKNVFRGIVARARLVETTRNGGVLEVDLLRGDFGPRERAISDTSDVGDLDLVPRRVSTLRRVLEVGAGAPAVLGDLGFFGNDRLFATVSVTTSPSRR